MSLKIEGLESEVTPKQIGELIWQMGSDEQAEMLDALFNAAGSEHILMMQFLYVRKECIARKDNSLAAFQTMFASAFTIPFGEIA